MSGLRWVQVTRIVPVASERDACPVLGLGKNRCASEHDAVGICGKERRGMKPRRESTKTARRILQTVSSRPVDRPEG